MTTNPTDDPATPLDPVYRILGELIRFLLPTFLTEKDVVLCSSTTA